MSDLRQPHLSSPARGSSPGLGALISGVAMGLVIGCGALVSGVVVSGCGAAVIPNTDVADTAENRQVVDFVEEYRHAVEERNPAAILRLVSERYFDDNGTPATDDDMDYETLRERFGRWSGDVIDVRYEMRYRRVTILPDRIFVDFTYTGSFKVRDVEGDRWSRRLADNRIEIVREGDDLRIISGL